MKSLRAQLTLRLLIGGAVLLATVGCLLHWQMRRALTAEFDVSVLATLNRLTMLVEQKRGRVSIDFTGADVSQLVRADGGEFLLAAIQRWPGTRPLSIARRDKVALARGLARGAEVLRCGVGRWTRGALCRDPFYSGI